MALLLIESVESFAIALLDALTDWLTHCSLPQTTLTMIVAPSIRKE